MYSRSGRSLGRWFILTKTPGNKLTTTIQPFWAIPLLAFADLRTRDIIGYMTLVMLTELHILRAAQTRQGAYL